jgi:hypothetical protein
VAFLFKILGQGQNLSQPLETPPLSNRCCLFVKSKGFSHEKRTGVVSGFSQSNLLLATDASSIIIASIFRDKASVMNKGIATPKEVLVS